MQTLKKPLKTSTQNENHKQHSHRFCLFRTTKLPIRVIEVLATLNASGFSSFFNGASVFKVEGSNYSVQLFKFLKFLWRRTFFNLIITFQPSTNLRWESSSFWSRRSTRDRKTNREQKENSQLKSNWFRKTVAEDRKFEK